jgi:hypothetical protein
LEIKLESRVIFNFIYRKKCMRINKLVPIVGFCAVSLLSSSAIATELWAISCGDKTQQCLDATTDGVNGKVQVSQCDVSKSAQKWRQNQPFSGGIENGYAGFGKPCLDMNYSDSVVTNSCEDDKQAQHWTFGAWRVRSEIRNAYWGTGDGTSAPRCIQVDGTTVTAAVCNRQDNQMWYWVPKGETDSCPK